MIQSATYTDGDHALTVSVEKIEPLLTSDDILNFPRVVPLAGNRLMLVYGRGRHGGEETRWSAVSEDRGKTWADVPADSPWADTMDTAGILGRLKDGTIAYMDVFPREVAGWNELKQGPYHRAAFVANPTWRLRRFAPTGELVATETTRVVDLPWEKASYELYGTLLQLDNGDLLTAFQCQVSPVPRDRYNFTVFIARSSDRGQTFRHVHTFQPIIDGKPVGDEGFCEPDMIVLANGDILCLMRTGSRSTMHQSRSTDGGQTWSAPVSIGWPGVKPDLCLLSNGVLACSSGRGMYGHPQVTYAMFSLDGTGERWEYPFAFHTGPGCSYTSNMERDGKFVVVYSHSSFTKGVGEYNLPTQSIKWAVLDVSLKRTN